jgi:hypothetical protein
VQFGAATGSPAGAAPLDPVRTKATQQQLRSQSQTCLDRAETCQPGQCVAEAEDAPAIADAVQGACDEA